jgi:hypothetical protein
MRTSKDYLFTAYLEDSDSMLRIEEARNRAKFLNAQLKRENCNRRVRIDVKPRLGDNNPNSDQYRGRRCYTVLMEHGFHFDVYQRIID